MATKYVGKLKSLEELKDLYGSDQIPGIVPEMKLFFGEIHNLRYHDRHDWWENRTHDWWKIDYFMFHEKWFDWIKDDLGNLVYDKDDDFMTDIENMIDQIVEDL